MTGFLFSAFIAASLTLRPSVPVLQSDSLGAELAKLTAQVASQSREIAAVTRNEKRRGQKMSATLGEIVSEQSRSRTLAASEDRKIRLSAEATTIQLAQAQSESRILFGVSLSILTMVLLNLFAIFRHNRLSGPIATEDPEFAPSTANLPEATSGSILPSIAMSQPTLPLARTEEQHQPDHALALRVGDEIHRMRLRFSQLPETASYTKSLKRSVERIEESLNDAGYSIPDLAGRSYHDGMTMAAHFIPDESLVPEQKVIGKIIRPQINYRELLIQPAEVEVRTGTPRQPSTSLVS